MAGHFISLNCANCGAKLDIYDDMERFACGYCGTGMVVQRRGGTVTLAAVTEAIKKVQVGTDRTAAELALQRLDKEAGQLIANRIFVQETLAASSKALLAGIGCCGLIVVLALAMIAAGAWGGGLSLLVTIGIVVAVAKNSKSDRNDRLRNRLSAIELELKELNKEVQRNRMIVEGKQP